LVLKLGVFSEAEAFNLKHIPLIKTLKLAYKDPKCDVRKLLKLKHKLDYLDLNIQQLGVDLNSFMLDMKREVGHPFVSNVEYQNHEGNEVNFDLPLRFDECEE